MNQMVKKSILKRKIIMRNIQKRVKYHFNRDIEKIYNKLDKLNSKDLKEILNFIEGKLDE